jgi:hypothetical protein
MQEVLARAVLAHSMAQSIWEMLALIGPFAIVFGAGAVLVIGPIVRNQGERYQHRPIRGDETTAPSNGSAKPSRAAASSGSPESQVAASTGTPPEERN